MDEELVKQRLDQALASYSLEFGAFFLAKFLGLEIEYIPDACIVRFRGEQFESNPQGTVHGGIVATVMDISMGHLVNHLKGPATTLEMKVQYLRPVGFREYRAIGEVVKIGREIWFLKSTLEDLDGEVAAFATSTWKLLAPHRGGISC